MKIGRSASLLVALLLAATLVPGGWVAGEESDEGDKDDGQDDQPDEKPGKRQVEGRVLVPTLLAVRPFTPRTLDGISHYHIAEVAAGSQFTLSAASQPTITLPCVGLCSPDFDIVFYGAPSGDGFEHQAGRYNDAGGEAGTVPLTAEFALVFLRGPNTPPDAFGTNFTYREL